MQYKISHSDLSLILALVRGVSLARAASLLKVDVSTVLRAIRRLETELGQHPVRQEPARLPVHRHPPEKTNPAQATCPGSDEVTVSSARCA